MLGDFRGVFISFLIPKTAGIRERKRTKEGITADTFQLPDNLIPDCTKLWLIPGVGFGCFLQFSFIWGMSCIPLSLFPANPWLDRHLIQHHPGICPSVPSKKPKRKKKNLKNHKVKAPCSYLLCPSNFLEKKRHILSSHAGCTARQKKKKKQDIKKVQCSLNMFQDV